MHARKKKNESHEMWNKPLHIHNCSLDTFDRNEQVNEEKKRKEKKNAKNFGIFEEIVESLRGFTSTETVTRLK